VSLQEAWEEHASAWAAWARSPGHDSYWRFHRDQFLELVPPPGRLTLDVGCGEGRLSRDLKALGHTVIGVDASPTLVAAARAAAPEIEVHAADACALPFADGHADLALAFMSPQDFDDHSAAFREIARVLQPGGCFVFAIVHPLNSTGRFRLPYTDASPFVIEGSYLDSFRYVDVLERDGLEMTFVSEHRPIEAYFRALEQAGLLVEALREHKVAPGGSRHEALWSRVPLFLHVRARRP